MMRISGLILLLGLFACESESQPQPRPEPLVVYASGADEATLRNRFAGFTETTGIPMVFRVDDSAANTNLLITNLGSPPADVLITDNVADIWRAAEHGALRPIRADAIDVLPPALRDPDRLWAALAVRFAAIDVTTAGTDTGALGYAALADDGLHGQLCLSSSSLAVNRSLIAMLIHELGAKPVELIVRGWVRNLAVPPYATEAELREAVRLGECPVAILSQPYAASDASLHFDIDGMGIGRHSRYPDSAHRFTKWVLENSALKDFHSVDGSNVGIAGWLDQDAVLLTERAGYR